MPIKRSLAPHRITPAHLELSSDDDVHYNATGSRCDSDPSPSSSNCTFIPAAAYFDLVVIGAGPAALALVSRILESRPAALYTDQEHLYLHWLRKKQNTTIIKTRRTNRGNDRVISVSKTPPGPREECCCGGRMRILVIDKLGEGWMGLWDRQFRAFGIKHLRSPLFFHPAPADLDALIAFAEREGRNHFGPPSLLFSSTPSSMPDPNTPELIEIPGCVGAEVSKHKRSARRSRSGTNYARLLRDNGPPVNERDRRDYFTPGTSLFHDFVQKDIVERYGLDTSTPWPTINELMKQDGCPTRPITTVKGEVASLDWTSLHVEGYEHTTGFCLETTDGGRIGAKAVVCAVGMGGNPSVPASLVSSPGSGSTFGPGWAHSSCLASPSFQFPPKCCQEGTLVVIGGGLTSAQICDLALRKGFRKAILIMRGHLKVKPFDIGLDWMGRYSNLKKMEFWQEQDPSKRVEKLREARNGGSITPTYVKILKAHEERGLIDIRTNTSIQAATWDPDDRSWSLVLHHMSNHTETIKADYIVAATGASPSFASLPFIRTLSENPNVPACPAIGGLPLLDSHLQWPGLPLFCTGGYSALQIGPGAFNLGGMREAADRVVGRLEELAIGSGTEYGAGETDDPRKSYTYHDYDLLSVEG
ncbi:L-lysine 6-monooxygenase (NADPH-requiring) protein [Ceratobasidium sp. AG-Ba]|nr:L-lysine 6-monooxygenase (NADPH-requiring) protein [Ceratobasidium sp. AG-Ba]